MSGDADPGPLLAIGAFMVLAYVGMVHVSHSEKQKDALCAEFVQANLQNLTKA